MATSKTKIASKSLVLVGQPAITNLNDGTDRADTLNEVYEETLRSVLSECAWNFAMKRKLLNKLTSASTPEWNYTDENYIYAKPSDCIRMIDTNYRNAVWRPEGDKVYSNTDGLGVRYVYFLDDPSKYSASFIEAFADKLAANIAYTVLNSATLATEMLKKYEGISLPKAQSENAQVGTQQTMNDSDWTESKYGGSGNDVGSWY